MEKSIFLFLICNSFINLRILLGDVFPGKFLFGYSTTFLAHPLPFIGILNQHGHTIGQG